MTSTGNVAIQGSSRACSNLAWNRVMAREGSALESAGGSSLV
jgi:hypothetical protein